MQERGGSPIRKFDVGIISRKDLIDTAAYGQDIHRADPRFNVDLLPEAKEALPNYPLKVFTNDVVYRLIEDYQKWVEEERGGSTSRNVPSSPSLGR